MPETTTLPQTISLSSESLIEAAAELYAVETLLIRLWGYQEGGTGNIADRVGGPASSLLKEAFGEGWCDDERGISDLADNRARALVNEWLRGMADDG